MKINALLMKMGGVKWFDFDTLWKNMMITSGNTVWFNISMLIIVIVNRKTCGW